MKWVKVDFEVSAVAVKNQTGELEVFEIEMEMMWKMLLPGSEVSVGALMEVGALDQTEIVCLMWKMLLTDSEVSVGVLMEGGDLDQEEMAYLR